MISLLSSFNPIAFKLMVCVTTFSKALMMGVLMLIDCKSTTMGSLMMTICDDKHKGEQSGPLTQLEVCKVCGPIMGTSNSTIKLG